jgi:hypothetical protein
MTKPAESREKYRVVATAWLRDDAAWIRCRQRQANEWQTQPGNVAFQSGRKREEGCKGAWVRRGSSRSRRRCKRWAGRVFYNGCAPANATMRAKPRMRPSHPRTPGSTDRDCQHGPTGVTCGELFRAQAGPKRLARLRFATLSAHRGLDADPAAVQLRHVSASIHTVTALALRYGLQERLGCRDALWTAPCVPWRFCLVLPPSVPRLKAGETEVSQASTAGRVAMPATSATGPAGPSSSSLLSSTRARGSSRDGARKNQGEVSLHPSNMYLGVLQIRHWHALFSYTTCVVSNTRLNNVGQVIHQQAM